MKKIRIILACLCAVLPMLLSAQNFTSVDDLVKSYSDTDGVDYTNASKAIIWMVKAAAPKGSMDGVKSLQILKFKDGSTSSSYIQFRQASEELYATLGIECLESEETDKGSMEVFAKPAETLSEYMMFMHGDDGSEVFMLMQGEMKGK